MHAQQLPSDPQQQARASLVQINRICFSLQGLQVAASLALAAAVYLMSPVTRVYVALLGLIIVLFSHAVVGYVVQAVARNIQGIVHAHPSALTRALGRAVVSSRRRVTPLLLLHLISFVLVAVVLLRGVGLEVVALPASPLLLHLLLWIMITSSAAAFWSVWSSLHSNARHLSEYLAMTMGPVTVANAGTYDA